ncbi:uncharacterized protein LOC116146890 [Pistacia vera]|uniref:uncharacterized protein LOC116146890 n=1 Tax=Pistacia vera TaxID=55513 RepID=UPI001262EEFD|nr:uncharacterized protein LOC116146890 [Pistacia vera]
MHQIVQDFDNTFGLKIHGKLHYFLGIAVHHTPYGLLLNQSTYAQDLLVKYGMQNFNPFSTPMILGSKLAFEDNPLLDQPSIYRSLIGALQYLTLTRPDLSFVVNKLSQFLKAPTVNHWQACKRILRYVQGTIHHGLTFTKSDTLQLEGYADADWAGNVSDRKSTTGYCIFLGSKLVQWCSKKQSVVALSSTKAKYRALAQASTEIAWLQNLFQELCISLPRILVLWCDNTSAGALASNPVFHACTKHIKIDVRFVHEMVYSKRLVVQYVATAFQVADILTKPLSGSHFCALRDQLHLMSSASSSSFLLEGQSGLRQAANFELKDDQEDNK